MELEGKFHGHWQIFIGRFSIIASTSPAKHFEANTKIENCKSLNFYPLRSRRFHGLLASNFPQDCTSLYVSIGPFLKKKFSKALFKVNLALWEEKLNFWQFFFVKLVIAEFYVSRRPFIKTFWKTRVSPWKLADQNFFRNQQIFLCGSRNWSQIVRKIILRERKLFFQNTLIIFCRLWGTIL